MPQLVAALLLLVALLLALFPGWLPVMTALGRLFS
jgi:hypothetical protein